MASGPPTKRRLLRRAAAAGAGRAARAGAGGPERAAPDRARERRRLVVGALVVTAVLTAAGVAIRARRDPNRPPAEVERIAGGLRGAGHDVDRVARNANGGWSVLFDDGEVAWFKSPSAVESRLHPVRVAYEMRRDPNIVVIELHATVFAVVMSGRRQGSTLELGTAPTGAAEIAASVRTAVSAARRR